ncbi:MAG: fimbrillin family protein [Parabacteroides sp.]|nr:fimbrillin family protein [Parabacteroides sp.]
MKQMSMYVVLLAVLMSGCSSNEENGQGSVEIKVGATVSGAVTKAPVTTGESFTAAITAFEGANQPSDWTAAPAWGNSITLVTSETATGTSVSLNVSKVYPNTGNVYMAAWHPAIESVSGVVTFEKTGTEDVMYGGIVTGSKTVPAGSFTFKHVLTQLNF